MSIKRTFPFEYTRFEKARIIGSRALQIALGAPILIETNSIDPLEIAKEEFERGVIPITVRRRRESIVWLERYDMF